MRDYIFNDVFYIAAVLARIFFIHFLVSFISYSFFCACSLVLFFRSSRCRYVVTPSARTHRAHLSAADGIAVICNSCNGVLAVRDYLRCIPDF